MVSSRSWPPLPLTKMAAGNGPGPFGTVSVPASLMPLASELKVMLVSVYGNGA
jgi:hypothetical protein